MTGGQFLNVEPPLVDAAKLLLRLVHVVLLEEHGVAGLTRRTGLRV